jgi:hypothetical protein
MRRVLLPALAAAFAALMVFTFLTTTHAEGPPTIELHDPYCYQPDPSVNACYVNFRELTATNGCCALNVTVTLGLSREEANVVAAYNRADDYEVFATHEQNGMGFLVACGEATSPEDQLGQQYALTAYGLDAEFWHSSAPQCPAYHPGLPTAIGTNSFTATLDRLSHHQATFVALAVAAGLLVNLLVPARLKQWRKRTE